jgi:2-C-methyl-D-erythritol 4-phosphate cytidylyltransferase
MVYGVILASGIGSRMKSEIPKQFLQLDGVPIVIFTIFAMISMPRIDHIVLVSHPDYIDYVNDLLADYLSDSLREKISVIAGGKERIDSIDNAVSSITSAGTICPEDVIIFHDAVRPFVTHKILSDSIDGALACGAAVAGLPAVDTMLYSENGKYVDSIPDRARLYNGQAPDSFRLEYFIKLRNNICENDKSKVFGTSQICQLNQAPMAIIPGDEINFKVTTPRDLRKAEFYLKVLKEEDNESIRFMRDR